MLNDYSVLFDPVKIGKLEIKNKYFMAPMAATGMVDESNAYTEKAIDYYVERAKGGTGLIITSINKVENVIEGFLPNASPVVGSNLCAYIQSAKVLTERVHAYGSKIFLQLGVGMGRVMMAVAIAGGAGAVAPSEIENKWDPSIMHRELTIDEIHGLVKATVKAAALAKGCGFDGVEIHAVHEGYLLDQFTMDIFNKRTDEYGGSFENRYRMAVEIVQGIKKVCGQDYPVALRYSAKSFIKELGQGGLPGEEFQEKGRDLEEGIRAAKYLVDAGYDALDVDAGTYDSWYWNHPPMYFEDGMYLPYAKAVKDVVDVPVLVAGRMDNPDLALNALENGSADMIGLGRPLLSDPDLVNKIRKNQKEKVRPCLSCHDGCMGRVKQGLPTSCAVNPSAGREASFALKKTDSPKKVMIVGGGVAGLEAARVLTLRGHIVTLFEKSSKLGGSLIPGGMPPFKRNDHKLIEWYEREMVDLNVDVRMNATVTKEMITLSDYDTVIVATGANPINIKLPGSEKNTVCNAVEVSLEMEKAGENIAIIGAGLVGGELGLWLAQMGKKVTIVEMTNQILGGEHNLCTANYDMLKDLLKFNKVEILTETKAEEVTENGLKIQAKDGTKSEIKADTIITAVGYRRENNLYESIKMIDKDVFNLGDSKEVHNIMYAVWDAYEVARNI
ncbi:MAG: FAD-dependent oxidoreductase [Eubacteriaceae bacterium]